jgi:hypothetical protein
MDTNYEQCEQCAAPLDHTQRYCVVCGHHRRHVRDPAARYLARSTSRSRGTEASPNAAPRRRRSSSLATAVIVAVIPLAIGLGVLVGRASTSGDAKLIAALQRAQAAQVVTTAGSSSVAASTGAGAGSSAVSSTFPLQSGYAVELQTLSGTGTTQAALTSAESSASANGAKNVGVIAQTEFKVTPGPPAGAFVIYAGAFKTRAAATRELAKLHTKFPQAVVIKVQSVSPGGSVPGAGQVLSSTQYGTAHQIAGFHATQAQLNQGAQIVQHIQQTVGKSYVNAQRGLPDQISVP